MMLMTAMMLMMTMMILTKMRAPCNQSVGSAFCLSTALSPPNYPGLYVSFLKLMIIILMMIVLTMMIMLMMSINDDS